MLTPGKDICESCGWDFRRGEPSMLGFIIVFSVVPLMCCGYCTLGYPIGRFVSPILANPWLWLAVTCWILWAFYSLFLRDEGRGK